CARARALITYFDYW
nr:immunoglobulin heavy chain junction region [Mus musculus]